jgi:hypothetical protein
MPTSSPLAPDLARTNALAGLDPTLEPRPRQDAIRAAIATRRGSCDWTVEHASWVVRRYHPEPQTFFAKTREAALA